MISDTEFHQSSDSSSMSNTSDQESYNSDSFTIPEIPIDDFDMFPDDSASFDVSDPTSHPRTCLYEGSTLSTFQALSILFSWFSVHPGISKSAFEHLLNILHRYLLPSENNLPATYKKAREIFQPCLSPVIEYDCCVNDCVVFRDSSSGKYSKLKECPVCKEPRFQSACRSKSVPFKRFKYLPVETRVRRLFANEQMSTLIQSHRLKVTEDGQTMSNIHDSPAWKEWYAEDGCYEGDPRALTFAICIDGLNPFKKESSTYSMCPILLSPLNFPPKLRKLSGSMFLTGIIPGPKELKSTDPYVEIVVDEILKLNGTEVYDACEKENFKLQTNILLHIFDYPGQSKVFHCQGQYTHVYTFPL